jgi:hypothetical protein
MGEGDLKMSKLRDVIYGRPPMQYVLLQELQCATKIVNVRFTNYVTIWETEILFKFYLSQGT